MSQRIGAIRPSPTVTIDGRAKALREAGVDVVNFSAGEPDFPTPEHIKEAAKEALDANWTHYTPVAGTPALREAIAAKLHRENGLTYEPEEIIVTHGGKQALYQAVMALCDPGDEFLIIAPYWVSYPEQVRLAGGEPVIVHADPRRGFHVSRNDLEPAVTQRTRGVILNSPNNPTGSVWTRPELEEIAALVVERDLWVISDEIYEHLVYGSNRHVSIAGMPGMKERTVLVNGFSKSHAMTGWRLGYAAAPQAVLRAMVALQGHMTSCASSLSQAAALAALQGPREPLERMRRAYDARRTYVVDRLNRIPGIRCVPPEGAFYVFVGVETYLQKTPGIDTDIDLATYLLEEAHVALVPGTGFGTPGYVRISYATSLPQLEEGLDRIERALRKLSA